jgi:hypothetical protein
MAKQLTNFGLSSAKFDDTKINDEEDTYYEPLLSKKTPVKVVGNDRLIYAIIYVRVGRIRDLIIMSNNGDTSIDLLCKDYYGLNIISQICRSNQPSNINYNDNKKLYEDMLLTTLNTLTPETLDKLFLDLQEETKFGKTQLENLLEELSDKPHLLLALWNYGLQLSIEQIDSYKYTPIKHLLKSSIDKPFIHGKRYLNYIDRCPISLTTIQRPALLTDGRIYELEQIRSYLTDNDISPVSREELVSESHSSIYKNSEGKWVSDKEYNKTLYIPLKNKFIHIKTSNEITITIKSLLGETKTITLERVEPVKNIFKHVKCLRSNNIVYDCRKINGAGLEKSFLDHGIKNGSMIYLVPIL